MKQQCIKTLEPLYLELLKFVEDKGGWEETTAFIVAKILKVLFKYILIPFIALAIYLSITLVDVIKYMGKRTIETGEELLIRKRAGESLTAQALKKLRSFLGLDHKDKVEEQINDYLSDLEEETFITQEDNLEQWDDVDKFLNYKAMKAYALNYIKENPEESEYFAFSFNPNRVVTAGVYTANALDEDLAKIAREMFNLEGEFTFEDLQAAYKQASKKYHPDAPTGSVKLFNKLQDYYEMIQITFYSCLTDFFTIGSPAHQEYRQMLSKSNYWRKTYDR